VPALNSIYGLFLDPDAAERGMNALRAAGVAPENILVMSAQPFDDYSFTHAGRKTVMPWLATLGGLVGGTCGFLLARYTQVAYPSITGGMPLVSPWPTAIVTYELTMFGAVMTTVIAIRPRDFERQDSNRRPGPFGCRTRRFGTAFTQRRCRAGKIHLSSPEMVSRPLA
jgi:hypothetical protein